MTIGVQLYVNGKQTDKGYWALSVLPREGDYMFVEDKELRVLAVVHRLPEQFVEVFTRPVKIPPEFTS